MSAQRESSLQGTGGLEIFWRAWLPDGDASAVVVIAHGAGEHSGRYTHVAQRLVEEGYAVYAIEHRGHGRSQGPRALIDRIDHAVADLDKLVVLAADAHPGAPVFLARSQHGRHDRTELRAGSPAAACWPRPVGSARGPGSSAGADATDRQDAVGARSAHAADRDRRIAGQPRSGRRRRLPVRSARAPRQAPGTDGGRARRRDRGVPRSGRDDHRADADHVRDRRRPVPAARAA